MAAQDVFSCSQGALAGKLDSMNETSLPTADTQPLAPRGPAGRRETSVSRSRNRAERGRWLLLTIIVMTSCSLALTVALFAQAIPSRPAAESIETVQVSIRALGNARTIWTAAETVGELLDEQGVTVPEYATLSHALDDRLRDGLVINIVAPRSVTLVVDGDERVVSTLADNPKEILEAAGVPVDSSDKVWVNGALADVEALAVWTVPARHIRIRRAARLTIVDEGEQSTIVTQAATIGEALYAAGVSLYLTDEVTPPLESPISGTMTVQIKRAIPIELQVDGVVIEARTNAKTVSDVLAEMNAPLFGLDYVVPAGDSSIEEGMRIQIVRVTEEVVTQSEWVKHEVRFQADAALNLDQRRLVQQGSDGQREVRSRLRYENGVEISRDISEIVEIEAPQHHVIAYGTNVVLGTIQTAQGPRQYWRRLCVYATRYNPVSNGGNTRTSTGAVLKKGVIAAKPQLIPYRTKVFVPGYGLGEILDTGGGLSSTIYWIDLGYSDHDYERGAGYTYVYLLGAPPADIDYVLPAWAPFHARPTGGCS